MDKNKQNVNLNESVFGDDEVTRYGFISHMEDFIRQLLKDPAKAHIDDYLSKHGIDDAKAIKLLITKEDPEDEDSAILVRKERIEDGGYDENGNRRQDKFHVQYRLPRKNYDHKMKKLYIKLFENYRCDNPMLNEEGEGGAMEGMGGATNCDASSGQFVQPLFKDIVRRKIKITEEQLNMIKEATTTTTAGNYQYDVPFCISPKDPANDHRNMMAKSWQGDIDEEGIHIKEKNKGKFTDTKKRTGKSTEELMHSKNPLTRKRANFARMAKRGWKPLKKD